MITGKQLKGEGVKITLDRDRILKFDLNAYCEIEDIYGNIDKAFSDMDKGSMKAIRALIYAGLKANDETLTLKEVGELIANVDDLKMISGAIAEAFGSSVPEAESDIEKK